jgi:glyoxylase-like metal-dependent hydrolase (beta-lactamase superfamily II)
MKKLNTIWCTALLLCTGNAVVGKNTDYLGKCWKAHVKPLGENYLVLSYTETRNELEHTSQPWQQTNYTGKGTVWYTAGHFLKSDSLANGMRRYVSRTQYDKQTLLFLDYGDKKLFPVTQAMFNEFPVKSARYSPALLVDYFYKNHIPAAAASDATFAVYETMLNTIRVQLYIRKADNVPVKAVTLSNDDEFGDVTTTYQYSDFKTAGTVHYAASVRIEKLNGRIVDKVSIVSGTINGTPVPLLEMPADYALQPAKKNEPSAVSVDEFNKNIHFVELKDADARAVVVEFADFLFVCEAPLTSENGQLILREAHKIAPAKPVRYFSFSHYHPYALGGVRPFVAEGAEIISTGPDKEFVQFLAENPHTLVPDTLQLHPKALRIKELTDSMTISDGTYSLKIYFIGKKSKHTNDFLIYYFPAEKMVFANDLVWINKEGEMRKAGPRQVGLYNAITELHLDVTTVVQSWPVSGYGLKSIVSFADLEKSVNIK